MSESSRRRSWLGVVTFGLGALLATSALAAGCGGKGDDGSSTADTGTTADVGGIDTTLVDSGKDTATATDTKPAVDSTVTYDAPGSLFDAVIPDVVFEGGGSSGACYDCTKAKCAAELTTCDADVRCRGLALCVLIDCKASTTDFACLLGCGTSYGVTSLTDPIVGEAQAIATCTQKNCAADCPAIPGGGDGGTTTDASTDAAKSDASADAADGTPAKAGGQLGSTPKTTAGAGETPVDPEVVEVLRQFAASFSESERQVVIDQLSSH